MPENRVIYVVFVGVTFPSLPIHPSHVRLPGLQADAVSRLLSHLPEERSTSTFSSMSRMVFSDPTAAP